MAVHLQWVGHACFRIWKDGGPVIVTDPYTPSILGFPELQITGDVIVASSLADESHSNVALVAGHPRIVNALEVAAGRKEVVGDGEVVALAVKEARDHPRGAQDNAMFKIRVGGMEFVHMGDLGYGLDATELTPLGRCDVLLALAGGGLTIPLPALDGVIDTLQPRWIVPMHHWVPGVALDLLPVEALLTQRSRDEFVRTGSSTVTLPLAANGDSRPMIIALEPFGRGTGDPAWH